METRPAKIDLASPTGGRESTWSHRRHQIANRLRRRPSGWKWSATRSAVLCLVTLVITTNGCAGYRFGASSLYRPDVQTIAVPVVESESLRPFLGERLTEAIVREIQLQTPYTVSSASTAQSILQVRILSDSKLVLGEDINDNPRDLQVGMLASVAWTNRLGEPLTRQPSYTLEVTENFVPEGGQSMVTAQQDVIDRLARRIVSQIEADW